MPIYEAECERCLHRYEWIDMSKTGLVERCPACGGQGEMLYSLSTPQLFKPFTTTNILPHGEEVTVTSKGHLRELERRHGVRVVNDPSYVPPRAKKIDPMQVYREAERKHVRPSYDVRSA